MTANQLRYWELRWKQYYEYYYLEEQKRSNRAREAETERHNRAEERIAKQELVLRRIELSQTQEKINQQWEKLKLDEQALVVNYALETWKLNQQAEHFLKSQEMAAASLIVQYANENEKRQTEKFSAYVDALDKGWDKATVAKVLTEIETNNSATLSIMQDIAKKYNLDIELHGPANVSSLISNAAKNAPETAVITNRATGLEAEHAKYDSKYAKDLIEKYGPAASAAKGLGGKASPTGGATSKVDYSKTGPISQPSNANKTKDGSNVIYSPSVKNEAKIGPGITTQGGFY